MYNTPEIYNTLAKPIFPDIKDLIRLNLMLKVFLPLDYYIEDTYNANFLTIRPTISSTEKGHSIYWAQAFYEYIIPLVVHYYYMHSSCTRNDKLLIHEKISEWVCTNKILSINHVWSLFKLAREAANYSIDYEFILEQRLEEARRNHNLNSHKLVAPGNLFPVKDLFKETLVNIIKDSDPKLVTTKKSTTLVKGFGKESKPLPMNTETTTETKNTNIIVQKL